MTSKNPTRYTPRHVPAPVFFVDPATGDVVELDFSTAEFKPAKGDK